MRSCHADIQAFSAYQFDKLPLVSRKENTVMCLQSDSTGKESTKALLSSDGKRNKILHVLTAIPILTSHIITLFGSNGKILFGSKWPVVLLINIRRDTLQLLSQITLTLRQWIGAFMGVLGCIARPRSTFFDGWFVRVMDKMEGISWAVIVGSIRLAGFTWPCMR
jgi:hypothetical protein